MKNVIFSPEKLIQVKYSFQGSWIQRWALLTFHMAARSLLLQNKILTNWKIWYFVWRNCVRLFFLFIVYFPGIRRTALRSALLQGRCWSWWLKFTPGHLKLQHLVPCLIVVLWIWNFSYLMLCFVSEHPQSKFLNWLLFVIKVYNCEIIKTSIISL